jgi:hypothetical protein
VSKGVAAVRDQGQTLTSGEERMSRRSFLRGGAGSALPGRRDAPVRSAITSSVEGISRRMFIGAGAAVAVVAAAPPAWARRSISALTARSNPLKRSRFTPALGSTLRMTGGGEQLDVVLAEITDLRPVLRADDEDRFALLLHVPGSRRPTSGIRTLRHPDIGEVALFVAPVDRGVNPVHYEAVINRSRS